MTLEGFIIAMVAAAVLGGIGWAVSNVGIENHKADKPKDEAKHG
jgi:hypothetical protein